MVYSKLAVCVVGVQISILLDNLEAEGLVNGSLPTGPGSQLELLAHRCQYSRSTSSRKKGDIWWNMVTLYHHQRHQTCPKLPKRIYNWWKCLGICWAWMFVLRLIMIPVISWYIVTPAGLGWVLHRRKYIRNTVSHWGTGYCFYSNKSVIFYFIKLYNII